MLAGLGWMQGFPRLMPSGGRLDRKRLEACGGGRKRDGWGSLWLSQVSYNGFYLRLEEGSALRLVVHGFQLLHEHGATLYPSVEGLHGGFGTAVRVVEQSQFGLAIGTDLKHVNGFFRVDYCTSKIRNIYHSCKYLLLFFTFIKTLADIQGHWAFRK